MSLGSDESGYYSNYQTGQNWWPNVTIIVLILTTVIKKYWHLVSLYFLFFFWYLILFDSHFFVRALFQKKMQVPGILKKTLVCILWKLWHSQVQRSCQFSSCTLDSGINIGVCLLIFRIFPMGYVLIKESNS